MRLVWLMALLMMSAGCAGTSSRDGAAPEAMALADPARTRGIACDEEKVPQEVIMHLQLIEEMNRQGRYHAALAHLEALGPRGADLPRARFLRAEASRQTGDTDRARALFAGLTRTCLAGLGHHGLARLANDAGATDAALVEFAAAEQQRPTDPRIRNDHGYTLLLAGRLAEARRQFQTAWELGGGDQVAANLVLTMLVAGDEADARRFAAEASLTDAIIESLRGRATELRTPQAQPTHHGVRP